MLLRITEIIVLPLRPEEGRQPRFQCYVAQTPHRDNAPSTSTLQAVRRAWKHAVHIHPKPMLTRAVPGHQARHSAGR
ncbi:hypothetical protein K466DRAFT_590153 [Polyporus arcularius HHB13444]|uniref:Uncharacterized protein n=1 Tax=Polyporus arcularius HHB13444 TaxID=1314778 RepID=A0A5C3PAR3_9APHY|nr:hypothetical protein K466DRAFT_590153 [Polyporus arcularius HHB13444]